MTDDLAKLGRALRSPPPPDADARAAALTLALKNFDALQGSTAPSRHTSDPQSRGFLNGVRTMLKSLGSRPALAATTSVAALIIGLAITLPLTESRQRDAAPKPDLKTEAREEPQPKAEEPLLTSQDLGRVATTTEPTLPGNAATDSSTPVESAPVPLAPVAPATVAPSKVGAAPMLGGLTDEVDATSTADATIAEMATNDAISKGGFADTLAQPIDNTEAFSNAPANPVHITAEDPVSTFSVDVDTASYAVIRSSLNSGYLPTPDQVRIEEMINYFPYAYAAPDASEAPFKPSITVMPTPWNPGTRLVQVALQGRLPAIADRPPLNLVFLIDTSGSMDDANKLPLLKQSLGLLLAKLHPQDEVAIVAYAGSAGEVLPPTKASDRPAIIAALGRLASGGSTAGAEGIALAYQVAEAMAKDGEISRVVLATDGDFNVGIADPEALKTYIATKRDSGVYLSVLGFGRGNLDDATMQALAQNGNGQAAYIDTLQEAQKTLVDQLSGALFPIADDVKIQVEWNPAAVAEYRLIGYETRALRREDFNNDQIDAGEIGAGLQVTALYEVTAPGSPALRNDALRYGAPVVDQPGTELGFLRLRYKDPGQDASKLIETPITETGIPGDDARFAVAIAGFGQLLTHSTYLNDWGWDQAIALASGAKGADEFGYRIEAINLMRLAQSLSAE